MTKNTYKTNRNEEVITLIVYKGVDDRWKTDCGKRDTNHIIVK